MITSLVQIFIVLCIVGLIMYGISKVPGIPEIVKTVLYVLVGVIMLLWVYQNLGSLHLLSRGPS